MASLPWKGQAALTLGTVHREPARKSCGKGDRAGRRKRKQKTKTEKKRKTNFSKNGLPGSRVAGTWPCSRVAGTGPGQVSINNSEEVSSEEVSGVLEAQVPSVPRSHRSHRSQGPIGPPRYPWIPPSDPWEPVYGYPYMDIITYMLFGHETSFILRYQICG